jgi:2-polyprenyl-6-methoxyphenol hydroxylase-like FAD-dependent oxidoreductase
MNSEMRVLIAGGGIAGMAAAMACQKAGINAEIYEAYDESAGLEAGAYLTVAVNGLDALRAIDAHHLVIRAGFPTRTIRFQSGTGKHLGDIPIGGTLSDGTVTQSIKRSDLYSVLSRGVRRSVVLYAAAASGTFQSPVASLPSANVATIFHQ